MLRRALCPGPLIKMCRLTSSDARTGVSGLERASSLDLDRLNIAFSGSPVERDFGVVVGCLYLQVGHGKERGLH